MRAIKTGYLYNFQTCGFSVVDDIRAEIESQSDWDFSRSIEETEKAIYNAARRFGFFEPFTPEQKALAIYLKNRKVGLKIATYAWGLYAEAIVKDSGPSDTREFA